MSVIVSVFSCVCPFDRFMGVIRSLLDADQTYYHRARSLVMGGRAGPVLQLMHAMMHCHVLHHQR